VPDPDVIVVSNAPPGLVLIAVLDDAFTYQFTGDTSGLVPGNILVNEDPTFPYRRLVVFVHEEPTEHEVTVLTTNAPLSESLAGGSVQVGGELDSTPFIFTSLAPAFPFQAAAVPDCCSVTISNRLLASGPDVNALISGRVELQPALAARGVFQAAALAAMDFDFQGKVVAALELEAEGHTAGNFTNRLTLGSATNRFPPTYAGPVPASASVAVAFELVMESSWPKPGRVRIGMLETNLISLNAQLREQNWTTRGTRLRRFSLPPARSDDAPTAQVRLYLEEHVTLELERSPAIALTLRPGLEALALASAPPGMTGSDLTLHASLTATLAIQPSAWDVGAPSLPATNILSTRDFAQHLADFARIGPRLAVQPIPGMVWVAPGSFQMGDSPTNPPTQVTLTRGFYIGRREVAQAEYAAVLYTNESYFHGGQWGTNAARPIEWLSWHQATNYCARLTAAERQANHIPSSYGYRLPTEAEWEFAARAGTTNAFPTGDQLLPGWANFACGADPQSPCAVNPIFGVIPPELPRLNQTVAGGLFAPNRWGLHDTAGNVREWCLDWLGNSLPAGTLTDPQGTDTTLRAVRGGSFDLPSSACRFSSRQFSTSSAAAPDIGFRVVLAPAQVVSGLESYTNTLRPGLSIVANQLNHPVNNRITTLFTNRVFLSLSKLVPGTASFDTAVFDPDAGEWSDPTGMTLNPGEAVYVDNLSGAPVSVTFYGERVVNFTRPPLSGQHMLSNPLPEPGTYFAIVGSMPTGLVTVTRAREDGSSINYIYDPDAGGWSPEEPIADIGEGFVFDFH
jgi:formylglycine-generating enzyme required for sulfatase activity